MIDELATPNRKRTRSCLPQTPISPNGSTSVYKDILCPGLRPDFQLLTPPPDHSSPPYSHEDDRSLKRVRIDASSTQDIFADAGSAFTAGVGSENIFEEIEREIGDTTTYLHHYDQLPAAPLVPLETFDDGHGANPPGTSYEDQAFDCILADDGGRTVDAAAINANESHYTESPNDEVCFGMLGPIPFAIANVPPLPPTFVKISLVDHVSFDYDNGCLYLLSDSSVIGQLPQHAVHLLRVLHDSNGQGISLQLRCIITRVEDQRKRGKGSTLFSELKATVAAIIYGPLHLFTHIGNFFEECDICLQDPIGECNRNVRYRNPHKYSGSNDDAPMTIDRDLVAPDAMAIDQHGSSDYLDDLNFQGELPEADVPFALRTQPLKHQRQGLQFMLTREQGWSFAGELRDIWRATRVAGIPMYWNTINDDAQEQPPIKFRGGLLLDEMGLGKTLTIISLVASDIHHQKGARGESCPRPAGPYLHHSRCTLVIVPPPLLEMWEEQLRTHVRAESFRWYRHHGSQRLSQLSQLTQYDLVLTTYNTVTAEWKSRTELTSVLLQAHWHRIVLDEAQDIRDPRSQAARAICSLKADRRWCVTGTPIQNHLGELKALLHFLRAYPYDNAQVFERDIANVWKTDDESAVRRLKHLITSLGLRRPRKTVDLPHRTHMDISLDFSISEKELYEPLELQITSLLNQAKFLPQFDTPPNALQGLNALRLVCNFGTLSDPKHLEVFSKSSSWGPSKAQELFNSLVMAGQTACAKCSTHITSASMDMTSSTPNDVLDAIEDVPSVSACERVLCGSCNLNLQQGIDSCLDWCGHSPLCPTLPVGTNHPSSDINRVPLHQLSLPEFPTKIRALISNLQLFPGSKSVVFSFWRTTLDLCAAALSLANIPFVRFDGKVRDADRLEALSSFRSDPKIKIILFTISCGAVGLDLTAADRAYLMEPQWNPTVEDQAFARIHRMGQTKPVTTVRFLMRESYEERVTDVQKQKRNFADLLLNTRKSGGGLRGGGGGAFETVRKLICRR